MTDNIVERADLAVDAELQKLFPEWEWDQRQAIAAICARAAISALREPSEAMIEAGVKCHDHYAGAGTVGALNARRNVRQILVAAIDTALTEGTEHAG
jgi:hypothetical protein